MNTTFIYKKINDCEIKGDFYPVNEKQAPLIVYLHGGGLIWGQRQDIQAEQISLYQKAGFNVCSIDYRLAPETKLTDIVSDIKDALVWFKKQGHNTYDYDENRIAVVGSSAGGYLALLTGIFELKPQAIVSFYGYGNILGNWYTKPSDYYNKMTTVPKQLADQLIQNNTITEGPIEKRYAIYLYCRQQGKWHDYVSGLNPVYDQEKLKTLCPIDNINKDFPPTLFLHGDQDKDVPYQESVNMHQALDNYGVSNHLITIPNGEHAFDQDTSKPIVSWSFNQVVSFLKDHLL